MKVMLVSANREQLPDPVFPLGVAYVAGALEEAGHEVEAVDLCFVDEPAVEQTLRSHITRLEPDVIGMSLRNIDDSAYPEVTSYTEHYRRIASVCRQSSKATLVVGGSAFTIMPSQYLSLLDVDYGVVGEGERALVELLARLDQNRTGGTDTLPGGVVTRGREAARAHYLDDWERFRPARRYFSAADYYEKGGMLNLQTRRGCPFRCAYCTYPRVEGSAPRLRPIAEVVDELEQLLEYSGARHLFVVDSVFNHPREYARAFCDEVIARGLEFSWSCYASAGRMDGELVERMVRAGCEGVEFGTDGLVDEVLDALGKGFTYADVQESSRLCRELGLRFCHFLFLGSPGERPDQARLALERLATLEADSSMIMTGIRLFPGTPLAERARRELGIEEIGLDPLFYIAPTMADELEGIVERVIAEHPSWVLPGFRRNFSARIQQVLRRAGKRGVLWDFLSRR